MKVKIIYTLTNYIKLMLSYQIYDNYHIVILSIVKYRVFGCLSFCMTVIENIQQFLRGTLVGTIEFSRVQYHNR